MMLWKAKAFYDAVLKGPKLSSKETQALQRYVLVEKPLK